ncbi:Ig-like domain-containing protein [Myxococcus sp. RHSTA-1-4]|uniref:Ig-like domain-containing protein n=1 Tax=Myxococcus sp. RHSTA-1-4 TaxID=2874601 RepID=UPI001CBA6BC4|nr:Ig-like domain-containing protein [Myxococcus sp. RHSTA-1-4]MBZ4415581.1 Ig-like domain-containing protein [Myxococcus sp. RHSTA-1-4]
MRPGLAPWVAFASVMFVACSPPAPATLEFVDQSPAQPRLGEITTLRFRAVDSRGQPQAGTPVSFSLQSPVPGVELSPTEGTTNTGDGVVSVQVVARGGRVASVVVVATASGDGETKTAVSPVVSFAGTNSSARQLTFQCGAFAGDGSGLHHAIGAWDETRHLIAGVKLRCNAHVGDRNGDGITGAQVSFLTEAGTIGPSAVTSTDVVGNAEVLYKSSYPLPEDVAPGEFTWSPPDDDVHTGEYIAPLWMHPFLWEENPLVNYGNPARPYDTRPEPRRSDPIRPGKVNNPRDNLVSIIAITSGEEAYDDNNNNGQWDSGEPFVDLTEPFVDNNDNGTWDPHERFVDTNGDGKWNGKNKQFDASTLIWVQERILWTGWPHELDAPQVFRQIRPLPSQDPATFIVEHFGAQTVEFLVSDPWYNRMAQNSNDDGCNGGASGPVKVAPTLTGIALTYPSFKFESYSVQDVHEQPPEGNPPPASEPPVAWTVSPTCYYTAAQLDGHKVGVVGPTVAGRVR